MKTICCFIIILLSVHHLQSQAPDIEWQKSFGGSSTDFGYSVLQTEDSGFVFFGTSNSTNGDVSGNHGGQDYWLFKTDSNGNLEWQKSFGGSNTELGYSLANTNDGGFIIAGGSSSNDGDVSGNHGNEDYWILRLDEAGNMLWQKSFGGSQFDEPYSIAPTEDNGFICAGRSSSIDGDVTGHHGLIDNFDYWIIKIDEFGGLEWENSFGGTEDDIPKKVISLSGENFIVAGNSYSIDGDITDNHGNEDGWLIKLNSIGNLQWEKSLGGSNNDVLNSGQITSGNSFIFTGGTASNDGDVSGFHGQSDIWVAATDSAGAIQWQHCYGGSGTESRHSIVRTFENDYVICGYTTSDDGDVSLALGAYDYWILRIDTIGLIKWEKSIGGTMEDDPLEIQETSDSALILNGWTYSSDVDVTFNHGLYDFWIVKLEQPCISNRYYQDADLDNFGNPDIFIYSCNDTVGFVLNNTDCNDLDPLIYPGAPELINGIDDNCNDLIDEGTGISIENKSAFSMYPNPVINNLTIQFNSQITDPEIKIFDTAGKLVFQKKVNQTADEFIISDLNLPPGNYISRVITKDIVETGIFEVVK